MYYPILMFLKVITKDLSPHTVVIGDKENHFNAAVEWLKLAHDKANREGVSYGYSIKGEWRGPYRETTGYIAVSYFNLARHFDNKQYSQDAFKMIDWEIKVQNDDGSISNPHFSPNQGIVFDTGQVLFGLVRAFEESKNNRYLYAAIKAGQWLVNVSNDDNRWTQCTYNAIPHVYNSRVAWSLLRLNQINPDDKWVEVARANLDFAVEQLTNGWFDQCAFKTNVAPFTHTIAYAIRGLYESSQLLNEQRYFKAAEEVAKSSMSKMNEQGFIPGQIAIDGSSVDYYCCLTGNCQLSIVWAKMYKLSGDESYREAAVTALKYVMSHQILDKRYSDIRGAIKGSHPVWGAYSRFTFPNWSTKFFIDAMLECWEWL